MGRDYPGPAPLAPRIGRAAGSRDERRQREGGRRQREEERRDERSRAETDAVARLPSPPNVIPAHAGIQSNEHEATSDLTLTGGAAAPLVRQRAATSSVRALCSRIAQKTGTVYLLASQRNGTLYLGVTSDLARRVRQHKEGATPGFSSRYGVTHLVWFEGHPSVADAIVREKQIKKWRRAWKVELIEAGNPGWLDLYERVVHGG